MKALGLETCATLGMLRDGQAEKLKDAGLDYYNHNLDTAPEFYGDIITHPRVPGPPRHAGARCAPPASKVCCGGIVGMGESRAQRAGLIAQLANLDPYPESVPINHLVQVEGTPLHGIEPLDPFEFVRTIAVARITMPRARVRLSAGRQQMGEAVQALCFLAGANSIFYGDKLLTTGNPDVERDRALMKKLGIRALPALVDGRPDQIRTIVSSRGSGNPDYSGHPSGSPSCAGVTSQPDGFPGLLDGHRLGQVPRLVHVGTADQRRVIGQQLQRHHVQDRAERAAVLGQPDDVHALRFRHVSCRRRRTRTARRRARALPAGWI